MSKDRHRNSGDSTSRSSARSRRYRSEAGIGKINAYSTESGSSPTGQATATGTASHNPTHDVRVMSVSSPSSSWNSRRRHVIGLFSKFKVNSRYKKTTKKSKLSETSDGDNEDCGISDTTIDGDTPLQQEQFCASAIPELSITPGSEGRPSAASTTASVRTVHRGKRALNRLAPKQNPRFLSPRSAVKISTRVNSPAGSISKCNSGRAGPTFPIRTSSLRYNHVFPFSHGITERDVRDSRPCRNNLANPMALIEDTHQSHSGDISMLEKSLPVLPGEVASTSFQHTTDSYQHDDDSSTLVPTTKSAYASDEPMSIDDTERATTPPGWPLPDDNRSLYGSQPSTPVNSNTSDMNHTVVVGDDSNETTNGDLNDHDDGSPTRTSDTNSTPRARACAPSVSGEVSQCAFHAHVPLDERVLTARLNQICVGFDAGEEYPGLSLMTRESMTSALSTMTTATAAMSFVTAIEDVDKSDESQSVGLASEECAAEAASDHRLFLLPLLSHSDGDSDIELDTGPAAATCSIEEHGPDAEQAASHDELLIPGDEHSVDLPFRVTTAGPPELSTALQLKTMLWRWLPSRGFYCPRLKSDPDVEQIKETIRPYLRICGIFTNDPQIDLLAERYWERVYIVSGFGKDTNTVKECLFRCILPGLPWYRIQLEVSSMEFVRHHTTIPVPRVYAFNASMGSTLGCEWILMEKVQGRPYADAKHAFGLETKSKLYRTVAEWLDQLSKLRFDGIGALYHDWNEPLSCLESYRLGPLNDEDFKSGLSLDQAVHRGHFHSMQQYANSRVGFCLAEALDVRMEERARYWEAKAKFTKAQEDGKVGIDTAFKLNTETEQMPVPRYTLETLKAVPRYCLKLLSVLPHIFGDTDNVGPAGSSLVHPDINGNNILVDATTGAPLALLGWERACTMPLAWTSRYPKLVADDAAHDRDLLRLEFDHRLQELCSPFLRQRADHADLDKVNTYLRMMRHGCLNDLEADCDIFVAKVRARARKAFQG